MQRVHTEDGKMYTTQDNEEEEVTSSRWCDFGGLLAKASLCLSELYAGRSKEEDCSRKVSLTTPSFTGNSKYSVAIEKPYAYRINSLLVGKTGVGKSSLMTKYVDKLFMGGPHTTTIGVEFASKIQTVRCRNGGEGKIKQHIWDTSGHESFASLTESYYTNAVVVYVVFSVTDRSSFMGLSRWIERARALTQKESTIVLVGNKIDATYRSISKIEGQKVAEKYGAQYIETSAKNGVGVRELFQLGATAVWRGIYDKDSPINPKTTNGIKALY